MVRVAVGFAVLWSYCGRCCGIVVRVAVGVAVLRSVLRCCGRCCSDAVGVPVRVALLQSVFQSVFRSCGPFCSQCCGVAVRAAVLRSLLRFCGPCCRYRVWQHPTPLVYSRAFPLPVGFRVCHRHGFEQPTSVRVLQGVYSKSMNTCAFSPLRARTIPLFCLLSQSTNRVLQE